MTTITTTVGPLAALQGTAGYLPGFVLGILIGTTLIAVGIRRRRPEREDTRP